MRLFIASRVSEGVAKKIDEAFRPVRSRVGRATWVALHAYHLTYAFLGEKDEAIADWLGKAIAELSIEPYEGGLSGGGFFPTPSRPRVGWLAFEDSGQLLTIATAVRQLIDGMEVSYDAKAFRPHLTVVRIRQRWTRRDVDEFLRAVERLGRIELCVDRVSLFRSEISPAGARHSELASVRLGG